MWDWYRYPYLTKVSVRVPTPPMNLKTFVEYCQHRFQVQPSWPAWKPREGHPVKRTVYPCQYPYLFGRDRDRDFDRDHDRDCASEL